MSDQTSRAAGAAAAPDTADTAVPADPVAAPDSGEARRAADATAGECLAARVAALTGAASERRHEELMEWAETELGLERSLAEQIHALSEEEHLLPVYGLLLVACGVGVRELEPPEQDTDDASQQLPPGWIDTGTIELDDVALERRLRASFRRFRSHLETGSTASAVAALLAEPDVGAVRLR